MAGSASIAVCPRSMTSKGFGANSSCKPRGGERSGRHFSVVDAVEQLIHRQHRDARDNALAVRFAFAQSTERVEVP